MSNLRADNAVVLVKAESTPGVKASLNASTDAVLVENIEINIDPNIVQTDEKTGTLDPSAPIPGGVRVGATFEVWMKGTSTPGTAPQWGELAKICGLQELITASAVPAAAEAAAAGSSTTLTLGAGAAGTLNAYRGMPINLTENPEDGNTDFIIDYTASKVATLGEEYDTALDDTTEYQIPVNVLYRLASTDLPTASIEIYMDGIKYELIGCVGDINLAADAGSAGKFTFTISGLLTAAGKVDAEVPSAVYDSDANGDFIQPPVWKNGKMFIDRVARGLSQFSIGTNNEIDYAPNPNELEGFDVPEIKRRRVAGTMDPNEVLVDTSNMLAKVRSGAKFPIVAQAGTVPGNRWAVVVSSAQATNETPGDRNRTATVTIPFVGTGPEKGFFLCLY